MVSGAGRHLASRLENTIQRPALETITVTDSDSTRDRARRMVTAPVPPSPARRGTPQAARVHYYWNDDVTRAVTRTMTDVNFCDSSS